MKISALILGIIGGIAGILGSLLVLFFGGMGSLFAAEGATQMAWLGFSALLFSIVGIISGALALTKPKVAGILMLVCGLGGVISISAFYIIGGPLLIAGGILALLRSGTEKVST